MGWCLLQTVPYLPRYGTDALRDAVAWIYAGFALILGDRRPARALPDGRAALSPGDPVLPGLGPDRRVDLGRTSMSRSRGIPGTDVPLLAFKGGDAGVLLAGIAAFILVGLYARAEPKPRLPEPLPWLFWLASARRRLGRQPRRHGRGRRWSSSSCCSSGEAGRWLSLFFMVALLLVVGTAPSIRAIDLGDRSGLLVPPAHRQRHQHLHLGASEPSRARRTSASLVGRRSSTTR